MTHAANPDELAALGVTLQNQITVVEDVIRNVDGPLNSIVWTGPAKDAFKAEWDTSFKGALGRLNAAFENAGSDCRNRAEAVRQVL
ncbi:WXG100 family type VII secretion target [Ilumatobacter sp.]|uniref:WXG100 family type VII secretion target n=1 Tax=Ilumatobacter sp. TaxID=1967498 RepID=UPI003B522D48